MTSHFQRSDGFDACSQWSAGAGALNANVASPARPVTSGKHAAIAPRTSAALSNVSHSIGTPSAEQSFTRIRQSSTASPGRGIARAVP